MQLVFHHGCETSLKYFIARFTTHVQTCLATNQVVAAASYPDVSLSMKMCAQRKAGRIPFPWSLAVHHQSLVFRARLYDEKNEAPVVAGYEKLLQKVESKTHSIAFKHVLQQCCKNRLYVFAAHFTVTEAVLALSLV